tara:strand:- start:717 stop:959 length:243 start_codon:yes stop_codon:yes gene_type:complete
LGEHEVRYDKVKVGDLIRRRWHSTSSSFVGQIYLNFKNTSDYGIVVEVVEEKNMVLAYFFNQASTSPLPIKMEYFEIISF